MAFAQLTYRESLRDIECCLRAMKQKLYHMGIKGRVSRSTLADANEKRDWRIYVLVAIIKKRVKIDLSLYTILQIFSITLFEKMPILQVLTDTDYKNKITSSHIQLKLFES